MSTGHDYFRTCPSCGKRFHVKRVGEQLIGEEVEQGEVAKVHGRALSGSVMRFVRTARDPTSEILPGESGDPEVVADETFRDEYKCGHCGHEWSEVRRQAAEVEGGEKAGYKGD